MSIYLDYAAATYVRPEVKRAMDKYFSKEFGNPSSFNTIGLNAKNAVESSREKIAKVAGCSPKEAIFTGSGTESINLAIKGVAFAMKNKGKHIITSKVEHHAVLNTCKYLEEKGFNITYLDVDKYGMVNSKDVEKAIKKDTILITIIYANNEIGTINPISEISRVARKHNILFHTDACQATGFLDINVNRLNVDLMTINSGKIYGPKGIGLLYIRKGTIIEPLIHGGGQEFGLRSGTENVPYIVGFAKALELADKEKNKESKRLQRLRDKLIEKLLKIPKTILNGHPQKRLPNNVNVTFLDIEGEALLLLLNEHGIYAATGSACASEKLEPSHVILAIGLPYEAAHGSIRFSLGKKTTKEDINKVADVLPKLVENLRCISPVNVKMSTIRKLMKR
ncbi:MAG: IscS subfamily cysteine desulfurase [Nanoarchaeota archaeon]